MSLENIGDQLQKHLIKPQQKTIPFAGRNLDVSILSKKIVKNKESGKKDYRSAVVRWILDKPFEESSFEEQKTGRYFAEMYDKTLIPIREEDCSIIGAILLFSLPPNMNHPPGTARKMKQSVKEPYIHLYTNFWGKFKIGAKIKGDIVEIDGIKQFKVTES